MAITSAREALSNVFGSGASPFGAPRLPNPRYTIGQFYADHDQPVPSYLKGFEGWTFDELNRARQAQQQAADLSGLAQRASAFSRNYSAFNNANFGTYTPYAQFVEQNASPDVAAYILGRFNPQPAAPATSSFFDQAPAVQHDVTQPVTVGGAPLPASQAIQNVLGSAQNATSQVFGPPGPGSQPSGVSRQQVANALLKLIGQVYGQGG